MIKGECKGGPINGKTVHLLEDVHRFDIEVDGKSYTYRRHIISRPGYYNVEWRVECQEREVIDND
jgi:hypothetical protein